MECVAASWRRRLAEEWRIASHSLGDIEKNDIKIAMHESPGFPKEDLQFRRFVFHRTEPAIILTPTLSDRAQPRAETPFIFHPVSM